MNEIIDNEKLLIEMSLIETILIEIAEYNLGVVSKEEAIERLEASKRAVGSSHKVAIALMLKRLLNKEQ